MCCILVTNCRHNKNIHEDILSAPDLGFFYLSNVGNKGFLDVLMFGLISMISLAIMTTEEVRCHIKLRVKRSC